VGILDRFFTPDRSNAAERHGEASKFLEWAQMDETAAFLDKIDNEAARNIDITDHEKMIASSVRANTLREVAGWLRGDIKAARQDLRDTEMELRDAG
jgi:hypothetical protein